MLLDRMMSKSYNLTRMFRFLMAMVEKRLLALFEITFQEL